MIKFEEGAILERSVLKTLLTDVMACRLYVFRLKEQFFDSEARRFIFSLIQKEFSLSQNIIPLDVVRSEIAMKHSVKKVKFAGELNYIDNSVPSTNMEASIRNLYDMFVGRETMKCLDGVSALLAEGKYIEAATEFRQKAFSIETTQDTKQVNDFFEGIKERISKVRDKRDHPERFRGLKTGFKTFDDMTGGLFAGEMTLLAGVTGLGKSTILKQIEFGILENNLGKNILHIANEEYEDQFNFKFDALFTGRDYLDFKFAKKDVMTEEVLKQWEDKLAEIQNRCGGHLYTREVPAFSDVSVIRRVFYELKAQGIRIDAIFIDHLPNMKPIQKVYGENDERAKIAAEVKELARELSVPVVIPTQAATQVEEKQMKGKRASKLDVYGSKAQIHHANTFFIITFVGRDNKTLRSDGSLETVEALKDAFILLDLKKNRDGPCFTIKLRHHVKTGKMEEIEVDPDVMKRWQKEHDEALRTGDYSTSVDEEKHVDQSETPTTSKGVEGKDLLEAIQQK